MTIQSFNPDRVTTIMGPRQAGKTTLARYLLKPDRAPQYYNLKDPDIHQALKKNGRQEFESYRDKLIILDNEKNVIF